jgi:hypothetical protein
VLNTALERSMSLEVLIKRLTQGHKKSNICIWDFAGDRYKKYANEIKWFSIEAIVTVFNQKLFTLNASLASCISASQMPPSSPPSAYCHNGISDIETSKRKRL